MVSQEIHTQGDKTKAKIGVYNIEVTNEGKDIKVFRRTMLGLKKLFDSNEGWEKDDDHKTI